MKILFQGDSVTESGRVREDSASIGVGYPNVVAEVYSALYPDKNLSFVNRGISGNRVTDLLARYEEDFLAVRPDVVSILVGINDTWRRYDENDLTSEEEYYNTYKMLLERIKKDMPNTKIIMIEPFLLSTIPEYEMWREDLDPKIQKVRKLAREYADAYLPMDGIMQSYVIKGYSDEVIAADSVHPTEVGHSIIAKEYMKVLDELLGY